MERHKPTPEEREKFMAELRNSSLLEGPSNKRWRLKDDSYYQLTPEQRHLPWCKK
jgi:hypothetical protein